MNPPKSITCAASDCSNEFYPVVPQQKFCSDRCCNRTNVRLCRARKRKGGGGNGGGGNGGGGGPMLFDELDLDSKTVAVTLPDTCYRTPDQPSKPPASVQNPRAKRATA